MQPLSQPVRSLATEVFSGLATPRALTALIMLRYSEWDQLATLHADPNDYLDSESYWAAAQASDLLRKYEPLPTSFDRKAVAEEGFISCERSCLRSNHRLYPLFFGSSEPQNNSGVLDFIGRVRKEIASILGPCPDLVEGRFGPGATFGDKGANTLVPDKISSRPTFTPDSWPFLFPWSGTMWASACTETGKVPLKVRGNRFTTVPKDCTKHRGIAIEPSINVYYQLAYGKAIRGRLRCRGIDLEEGQDTHRKLARDASITDNLATLDLSNASDTICSNLVKLLLPPKWFDVLDSLRSKKTFFKGHWHHLEKFSSMGNGFTFELETLIFLCLAAVSSRGTIGVDTFAYGDDIIIKASASDDVISCLNFFGFTVNKRKSFANGAFRESCGGDFFLGTDVRPFFLKEDISQPHKLIACLNGLKRSSSYGFRFESLRHAWHFGLSRLPSEIRSCRGPTDLGDCVIHDDRQRWRTRWKHDIRYIKAYLPHRHKTVRWNGFAPYVILASAVYGLGWNGGNIIPRSSVLDYKIGEVPYS